MIALPTIFLLLLPLQALAQTDYSAQLTSAALEIENAISPPCKSNTYCQSFVDTVVPRCQKLQGDAGCWCGNRDSSHNCAVCMASPTDNQTTFDQTASALQGDQEYTQLCNQFQAALNATTSVGPSSTPSTTNSQSSSTATTESSGGTKAPIGAIVGGVVGGLAVLLISAVVFLYWRKSRNNDNKMRPSNVSLFSAPASSVAAGRPFSGYDHNQAHSPPPQMTYNTGYTAPAMPYNGTGMHSPPLTGNVSFSKYPEPMVG